MWGSAILLATTRIICSLIKQTSVKFVIIEYLLFIYLHVFRSMPLSEILSVPVTVYCKYTSKWALGNTNWNSSEK